MTAERVSATLSKLHSECDLCGAWSSFTGKTETDDADGLTHVIVRCPNGHGEFPVWNRDREALVAAYERARATAMDPEAYQRAFATLTDGQGPAVAALVESPPAELPLFSVEDVALPPTATKRWVELVLEWGGWRPVPERSVRVEEALAAVIKCQSMEAAFAVVDRVTQAEASAVIQQVERRFHGQDPTVLVPILERPR